MSILRRQLSFDRLLARLFREDEAPWVLKGGYALELRFKSARSTIDIDLTVQRVVGAAEGSETVLAIRDMLQERASASLDDWFEFTIWITNDGSGRSSVWRRPLFD